MEAEREKFRAYLEKSGLMSALTNVLVRLYEEPNKPNNALNYVIETLGEKSVDTKRMEALEKKYNDLEAENKDIIAENKDLKTENIELKEKLARLSQTTENKDLKEKPVGLTQVSVSPDTPKES